MGNGAFNYYHWLIELLPRLQHLPEALARYPDLVILAPQSVAETPQLEELLRLLIPPGVEVLYVDRDEALTVENLLVPRHASLSVFNKRADHRYDSSDFYFDEQSVLWLRRRLQTLLGLGGERTKAGRRLFLARHGGRRDYNQDEVLDYFMGYGFEPVYLEDLSLRDQAGALAEAEAVAGPTGAAWSNLIFCSPGTQAFYWLPEEYGDFVAFDDLARANQVDLHKMVFPTGAVSTASLYQRAFVVPIERVKAAFDRDLQGL
ncbi:MAG TPA: glycosyltransferase family 61 protein [Pseudolysinimonas sp.]|nr:glycosyltransferase family 61 protein [Pseudolysinimonas sp.]